MRASWGRMVSCAPVGNRRWPACLQAMQAGYQPGYQPAGPRGCPCQPAPQFLPHSRLGKSMWHWALVPAVSRLVSTPVRGRDSWSPDWSRTRGLSRLPFCRPVPGVSTPVRGRDTASSARATSSHAVSYARGALTLALLVCLSIPLAAQTPPAPAPPGLDGGPPGEAQTAKPAGQEDAVSAPVARSPEMQVSRTDAGPVRTSAMRTSP